MPIEKDDIERAQLKACEALRIYETEMLNQNRCPLSFNRQLLLKVITNALAEHAVAEPIKENKSC